MAQGVIRVFSLTRTARYGIAVLSVVIAAALRWALDPFLGEVAPLLLFFLPVILAAWYGGLGPGLLATALSLLLGDYLFIGPRYSIFHYDTPQVLAHLVLVGVYGTTVSLLASRLRKSIKAEIESKERYRAFIKQSSEAIWRYELEQPIPITLPEDEQIEMLYQFGYLAECNDATAKMYGYDSADQIVGARVGDMLVRSDPQNIAFLHAFRLSGYRLTDVETREVDRYGNTKYFLNNLTGIEENGAIVRAWGTQRDITEQKLAEEALRESEVRLKRITEATQDALWEIDLKTNRLWWSEGARPLFGHSPGELEIGLEDWYRSIHPEDVDRVRVKFDTYMQSGDRDWTDEYRFRRADGSYVYIHDQGQKFYDEGGTPVLIAGAMADITERKRAEESLRESEKRLKRITDATQDALWEIDLKTNQLWWSEGAKPLFGHSPGELEIGLEDWYNGIHPEDVDRVRAKFDKFMLSGDPDWSDEYRFRRADGSYVYISDRGQAFYDESGIPTRIAGAMDDITERKRAEESLRESEERLRLAAQAANFGTYDLDLATGRQYLSPEMKRIFGLPDDANVAFEQLPDFIDPSDRERVMQTLWASFDPRGLGGFEDEYQIIPASGCKRWVLAKGRTLFTGEGDMRHAVRATGALLDISRRKHAEEALRENEERYRLLTELSPDGVVIAGLDGKIHLVNQSMLRMLGASPEYVVGRNIFEFLAPECLDYSRECMDNLMTTNLPVKQVEVMFRREDGRNFPVEVNGVRFEWNEQPYAQIVIHDISRRKQAEAERERLLEAIAAERDRLTQILEQMPIGVSIAEAPSGRLLFHNREAERLLRHPLLKSDNYHEYVQYGALHEDGRRYGPEEYPTARSLLSGEVVKDEETRYQRGDGTETFLSVNSAPIRDQQGPIVSIVTTFVDIAERKRAEEALRESEEWFSKAFRASPNGLVISRLSDGAILEVNDSFVSMSGYERDELIGKSTIHLGLYVDPADRQRALTMLKEQNYVRDFEFTVRRKSGETRLITFSAEPLELRGAPCWLTIVRDITEQKQAEEALRESEERFEKAFRASPDVLVITRLSDNTILEVNDSWTTLFGYDRDEVIGKGWDLFNLLGDPAERSRAQMILKENNRIRDFEMSVKRKTGEMRSVTISGEWLELRGARCFLTIVHDITKRKRAEESLLRSEEEMRRQLAHVGAIYATAPVGLCFMDNELRYVSINERLAEIYGKSVAEYLGRTVREALPEMADRIEPILRRVIETGAPVLDIEVSVKTAAHPMGHFLVSYYPIKNGDGRVLGVNTVVVDITQRKEIEEERERLLRQEKAAREEAEEASRMKDEFLATISHELRTPLTSILGWAHMLTGGSLSEHQARHAADVIAKSAQSQTRLIDDILDTSRIITGRLKLEAQPVEIERIFQATVDVIRPSAEMKGVALRAVIDAQSGVVLGDAGRLQQAIWNLLSNAVKFTNEGGRIEARLGRAGGQIEITVSDTGIGIEPQFLPHVFERFRQADSTYTRKYGGLGLGLAIVRHIVEMHGGGVSASSPGKGRGATFKIRLPLASTSRLPQLGSRRLESEAPQKKRRKWSEECRRLDGVRILLVEDDPETLDMLKFTFDECGAEVITATSASEALEALEHFRPDALVSDIAMPERDGYDLIRHVRSRGPERGGKIPAVAVTAYAAAEDRVRALGAGFQMHVAKPVDPDELIAVVASLTANIHC